ncbi:MAG: DUF2218 domain-containing protein [Caldilineaceae bacterium]
MISNLQMTTKDPSGFLKRLCHHFSLKIPAAYDAEKGMQRSPWAAVICGSMARPLPQQATADSQEKLDTVKEIVGQHVVLGQRENLQAEGMMNKQ